MKVNKPHHCHSWDPTAISQKDSNQEIIEFLGFNCETLGSLKFGRRMDFFPHVFETPGRKSWVAIVFIGLETSKALYIDLCFLRHIRFS